MLGQRWQGSISLSMLHGAACSVVAAKVYRPRTTDLKNDVHSWAERPEPRECHCQEAISCQQKRKNWWTRHQSWIAYDSKRGNVHAEGADSPEQ